MNFIFTPRCLVHNYHSVTHTNNRFSQTGKGHVLTRKATNSSATYFSTIYNKSWKSVGPQSYFRCRLDIRFNV